MSTPVFEIQRRPTPPPPKRDGVRRHTPEEILDALRAWAGIHGHPPTTLDWDPSAARRRDQHWRAERFVDGDWPSVRMVRRAFGSLSRAIEEAGLPIPRSSGQKGRIGDPDQILVAIRAWTIAYGDPPTQTDWDPYRATKAGQSWRVDRYHDGDWPSLVTVRKHFGGLSAATRAAGLTPASRHESSADRRRRRQHNRVELIMTTAAGSEGTEHSLSAVLRDVRSARSEQDSHALERAVLALAGEALAYADAIHARRLRAPN